MPKVTLWVPRALHQQVQELDAEVNLSALFQEALRARLAGSDSCTHGVTECVTCGRRDAPESLAAT